MNFSPSLRPYQADCADAVFAGFARSLSRVLYVLPTGTGKTVTFSEIIRRKLATDNRPALVLAHREELLIQARDTLARLIPGITVEIERGTDKASRLAEVIVASLPTVARAGTKRLDWLADMGPSVIIYDEAHHAAADGAGRALQRFGAFEGRTHLVGCTATPHRLDNRPLEGSNGAATFEECVYRYSLLEAIRDGWLCDLRGYVIRSDTDLSGVRTVAGDFSDAELARRVNTTERTGLAVKHWRELASDRPTIAFCADVEHAHAAAEAWRDAGFPAAAIDGAMSRDERRAVLDRFRRGEIQVLTNCQIATEGFDHPPIACVVMLRPTKSWSLYAQMAGRGTRLAEGKADCLLLDVVDNCDEHSLVTAPRLVDLPSAIDLDGGSLSEARAEMEELGDRAAHLPKKPGKWKDLLTVALEVPLFVLPEIPQEIAAAGRLRWYRLAEGYCVDCGDRRRMWIRETPLGWQPEATWYPAMPQYGAKPLSFRLKVRSDFTEALKAAESWIGREWPTAGRIARQGSAWQQDPPTPNQLQLIQKLVRQQKIAGFNISQITTKGQAGALITQLIAAKESAGRAKAEAMTG